MTGMRARQRAERAEQPRAIVGVERRAVHGDERRGRARRRRRRSAGSGSAPGPERSTSVRARPAASERGSRSSRASSSGGWIRSANARQAVDAASAATRRRIAPARPSQLVAGGVPQQRRHAQHPFRSRRVAIRRDQEAVLDAARGTSPRHRLRRARRRRSTIWPSSSSVGRRCASGASRSATTVPKRESSSTRPAVMKASRPPGADAGMGGEIRQRQPHAGSAPPTPRSTRATTPRRRPR